MEKVKQLILVVLGALLFPTLVLAQDDISVSTGIVGNNRLLGGKTSDSQTTVPMIGIDSSSNTMVNALSGKQVNLTAAKTPVGQFGASGNTLAAGLTLTTGNITLSGSGAYSKLTAYVPTMAATPAAATNYCPGGLCVVPTAAANTALLIGDATPVVGIPYIIKNSNASNTVRAKASGGATINGAVAGGYIGLAAGTAMKCMYMTTADLTCDSYATAGGTTAALPTPAGP